MLRRRVGEGRWQDVTAREFLDEVTGLAKSLIAAGIQHGDRVGLMSRTRYEWTLIDYAIWAAGAVTVPVYETSSVEQDRKSTRLNSSHLGISYAVFCLKK